MPRLNRTHSPQLQRHSPGAGRACGAAIPLRIKAAVKPTTEFARESTVSTSNTIYKALLLAGCAGTVVLATPAMAQAQDPAPSEDSDAPIVVTGSRIQRPDYNSTTPTVTV